MESSTYDWLTEGQRVEGDGREDEEDEDHPARGEYREHHVIAEHDCTDCTDQRVRLPTSPDFWYEMFGTTVGRGITGDAVACATSFSIASIMARS